MDEESRDLLGIAGRLRDALCGPVGGWMLGHAGVDDPASAEGENDEDVEDAESRRDEDEEVAGPGLVQVVPTRPNESCGKRAGVCERPKYRDELMFSTPGASTNISNYVATEMSAVAQLSPRQFRDAAQTIEQLDRVTSLDGGRDRA